MSVEKSKPLGYECPVCKSPPGIKCDRGRAHLERRYLAREYRNGSVAPEISQKKLGYYAYMASDVWAEKREAALRRDNSICRAMGCAQFRCLQVHHLAYPKVLGDEPVDSLVTLCTYHHMLVHKMARKRGVSVKAATYSIMGESDSVLPVGYT